MEKKWRRNGEGGCRFSQVGHKSIIGLSGRGGQFTLDRERSRKEGSLGILPVLLGRESLPVLLRRESLPDRGAVTGASVL